MMRKKVLVPIADGIEEIESVCIIDVLRRAGAEVIVASVDGLEITASRGVRLVADELIGDCADETYDLIVLPGGMPGAEHLRDCVELQQMLSAQKEQGRLYSAICASPAVVLGSHGLLDDKKATCHPAMGGKLKCLEAKETRVVVDGNCITSMGPGTAIEFAIQLVEMLFGADRAKAVADPMLVAKS